jgi:hypothetical protein
MHTSAYVSIRQHTERKRLEIEAQVKSALWNTPKEAYEAAGRNASAIPIQMYEIYYIDR